MRQCVHKVTVVLRDNILNSKLSKYRIFEDSLLTLSLQLDETSVNGL